MEKDIEDECCRVAWSEFGLLSLKQVEYKGLPDRIFFNKVKKRTTFFFVEFKDVGKKARKYQKHIHKMLKRSGVSVYTDIDDVEGFREICRKELHP